MKKLLLLSLATILMSCGDSHQDSEPTPSLLFVQNGTGGTLSDTTLTLTDVSSQTGWFTDRPYREAGQVTTEEFIALWDEGRTFADDPPNVDITCTVDSEVVNYVVELTSPGMAGEDLSYAVTAVADTVLPETTTTCDGASHAFFDDLIWNCDAAVGRGWNCGCETMSQCDPLFSCVLVPCEPCGSPASNESCDVPAGWCYPGTGVGFCDLSGCGGDWGTCLFGTADEECLDGCWWQDGDEA